MPISRDHKTANTFARPLRQATPRMLRNLVVFFRSIDWPELSSVADVCQELSTKDSWTLEDVAKASVATEKIDIIFDNLTDADRERLEAAAKNDPELNRYNLLARGGKMMTLATQALLMNVANTIPGMYIIGSKNMVQIYQFLMEAAAFATLVELKGGSCRCGCSFSGPPEEYANIKQRVDAASEEEGRLQDIEIKENMANFASTDVDLEVPGALYAMREEVREEQNGGRPRRRKGLPAGLQELAESLGLNLPPG